MTKIDVSGCEGYKDKHCRYETSIMFTEGNLCSKFPNCYYKQLKRLQEKYDTLTNKFFNSETDKTRLKQENAKLKEALEEISEIADKACTSGCRCIDKTDILIKIDEVLKDG